MKSPNKLTKYIGQVNWLNFPQVNFLPFKSQFLHNLIFLSLMHCTATVYHKKGWFCWFLPFLTSSIETVMIDSINHFHNACPYHKMCCNVCNWFRQCNFFHYSSVVACSPPKMLFGFLTTSGFTWNEWFNFLTASWAIKC